MKIDTYMCEKCLEPHVFSPNDNIKEYLCPICGRKMMYFGTEEIDPLNKIVKNRYTEYEKQKNNLGIHVLTKSIIKCPTCSSTNIQKIGAGERFLSVTILGLLSKKINKSFKCNDCGYTW